MGAVWCQAQTESNGLLCELCYCMQTPLVGASWPSHLVNGSRRPGGMPLSPGSCTLSGHQFAGGRRWKRSEEHTSELQSLRHLVCRLLLEKKKALPKDSSLLSFDASAAYNNRQFIDTD